MRQFPSVTKLFKFLLSALISIQTIFISTVTYANDEHYSTKVYESFFILRNIESNKISGFYLFNKMLENNADSKDVAKSLLKHASAIKTALSESKVIIDSKKYDKVCSRTNSERFYKEWPLTFNLIEQQKLVIYCSPAVRKPSLYTSSHSYTDPIYIQIRGDFVYGRGQKYFSGKLVNFSQYWKLVNILESGAKLINDGNGDLFANQELLYTTWQHKWITEKGAAIQCIVETQKQVVNDYQVQLRITDNTTLDVDIFAKNSSDELPESIKIKVANQTFDSTQYVNQENSRLFNYSQEVLTKITTAINTTRKYVIELGFKNSIKSIELVEPNNTKTMLYGYTAKQYCDAMKNNSGSVGIMFVEAVQKKELNDYIATQSSFEKAGVVLMGVNPSKKAYKHGLRLFDIVLGIDGNPVDFKTIMLILKSLCENESVTFNVLRDDAFLEFTI